MDRTLKVLFSLIVLVCSLTYLSGSGQQPAASPFAADIVLGDDYGITFSPDGKTMYFARRTKGRRSAQIMRSHQVDGKWSEPKLASFSDDQFDAEPFVSPDGSKLFFTSMRAVQPGVAKKDMDLWFVEQVGAAWSEPRHLAEINSAGYDNYPSVARNGTLYFGSARPGGKGEVDLYRSKLVDGKYEAPENLSINTEFTDADPYIAPDESYIIFSSSRTGTKGEGDLFISFRKGDDWEKPRPLGPAVNTAEWDYAQVVDPKGEWLYFSQGWGGVKRIRMKDLPIKRS